MNSNAILPPITQWLPLLPIWFVLLGGLITALVFWKDCPRPAALSLVALLLVGLASTLSPVLNTWLVRSRYVQGWTSQQLGLRLVGVGFVLGLIRAVGLAAFVAAVFVGRRKTAATDSTLPPQLPPATRIL